MVRLENVRRVMNEHHIPKILLDLLFLPLFTLVLLINCLWETVMWWIVAITMYCIILAAIGALVTLGFLASRGYKIYTTRFDEFG